MWVVPKDPDQPVVGDKLSPQQKEQVEAYIALLLADRLEENNNPGK